MPNAVPLMRASEIRTMSVTPRREQALGDRELAPLGHPGAASRAGVPQHEHRVGGDVERRVVDPCGEVVDVLEHDRGAAVAEELRRRPRCA